MAKRIRYWLWQTEEMVVTAIAIAVIFSVFQSVINGSGEPFQMLGILLTIFLSVLLLLLNAQNVQFLSLSLMLGRTRKNSLLGVIMMHLCFLVQIELVQLLFCCLPFMDKELQLGVAAYTPVAWLFISGVSYLLFIVQLKSEKIYAVINAIICMAVGGVVGFLAVVPAIVVVESEMAVVWDRKLWGILLASGVVLYAVGLCVYARNVQKLDTRV